MTIIRDPVGNIGDLAFQTAIALGKLIVARLVVRTVMPGKSQSRLVHKVEPLEIGIGMLQEIHDPQSLPIMLETAAIGHKLIQNTLACMTERAVAKIVPKQLLVWGWVRRLL